jgi:hypothetical protein
MNMSYITWPPSRDNILDDCTANKLARICGMLGSGHAGQRATAALKADQLLRDHGLTWYDIVVSGPVPSVVDDLVDEALSAGDGVLNCWEYGFLRGIRGRQHLTKKQLAKLDDIVAKIRGQA